MESRSETLSMLLAPTLLFIELSWQHLSWHNSILEHLLLHHLCNHQSNLRSTLSNYFEYSESSKSTSDSDHQVRSGDISLGGSISCTLPLLHISFSSQIDCIVKWEATIKQDRTPICKQTSVQTWSSCVARQDHIRFLLAEQSHQSHILSSFCQCLMLQPTRYQHPDPWIPADPHTTLD